MEVHGQHRHVVAKTLSQAATFEASGAGSRTPAIAIIGAGPAGLFAAEQLAARGCAVTVYERMASPARKFLMAGRGGLNLTHGEDLDRFLARYHDDCGLVRRAIATFPPRDLIAWANGLGAETFVGSSGRVFPKAMKASPLLRAWIRRLAERHVELKLGWTWRGFAGSSTHLSFDTPSGNETVKADAVVLALGGASWPRLGSDGAWGPILQQAGVSLAAFVPSNCGVRVPWSAHMAKHFGAPLKRIAITCGGHVSQGEAIVTATGLEGGAVYALSYAIRQALAGGDAFVSIDLRPDLPAAALAERLARAAPKDSLTNALRKVASLSPQAIALLREAGPVPRDPHELSQHIKQLRFPVTGLAGLKRAISTAGGVTAAALDDSFMLRALPGVFVAGEMLDFDAPTGGYLLQAAFASGFCAARGAAAWVCSGAATHTNLNTDA